MRRVGRNRLIAPLGEAGDAIKRLRPTANMKKPGAVSRPGTLREFQFPEYIDSRFASMHQGTIATPQMP
jgi:hypothetical protein